MLLIFLVVALIIPLAVCQKYIPVDLPKGGRKDVHGWLIMPLETNANSTNKFTAWFSHHVPEFWTDSPHNFQIIIKGELISESCAENEIYDFSIPLPPHQDLLMNQYSFTPPSPFSLNDLLAGRFHEMRGIYYNGSFHSSYPRSPENLATLRILEIPTAVYLHENQPDAYKYLRYLSHPRGDLNSGSTHFYFSHEIRAQPDFDQQMHVTIDQCTNQQYRKTLQTDILRINKPGTSWEFEGIENTLEHRLTVGQVLRARLVDSNSDDKITCQVTVLEDLSCMRGSDFMYNCDDPIVINNNKNVHSMHHHR